MTDLEHRSHLAMERCGPTLLRTVAIIMVITNWTPNTAITLYNHSPLLVSIRECLVFIVKALQSSK